MRAFWITVAATLILLIIWGIFVSSTDLDMKNMTANIDSAVVSINQDDWQESQERIDKVLSRWSDRRLVFSLFFDAVSIDEVESLMAKASALNKAKEKGSLLAELANLRHSLLFLLENEKISIENIL